MQIFVGVSVKQSVSKKAQQKIRKSSEHDLGRGNLRRANPYLFAFSLRIKTPAGVIHS